MRDVEAYKPTQTSSLYNFYSNTFLQGHVSKFGTDTIQLLLCIELSN